MDEELAPDRIWIDGIQYIRGDIHYMQKTQIVNWLRLWVSDEIANKIENEAYKQKIHLHEGLV